MQSTFAQTWNNALKIKLISAMLLIALLARSMMSLAAPDPADVRKKLAQIRPDLPIREVRTSQLPGFYEVVLMQGTVLFVNEDMNYFVAGDLYRIEANRFVNVSEEGRSRVRKSLIDEVDESDMVIFSPQEGLTKASVTVFTDVDCGYCRKLHKEVPELNRLGIEVRYLAYPRAGIGSDSYNKMVSAWCADNPQLALTRSKLGQAIEEKTCENPVAAEYELGNKVGVTGTPAIVYEDGTLLPGYLPARELARRLGVN